MSNAVDPVDRAQHMIRSCPCDGDCSSCEVLQQLVDEVERLRESLRRISCIAHPETHRHVYRGA